MYLLYKKEGLDFISNVTVTLLLQVISHHWQYLDNRGITLRYLNLILHSWILSVPLLHQPYFLNSSAYTFWNNFLMMCWHSLRFYIVLNLSSSYSLEPLLAVPLIVLLISKLQTWSQSSCWKLYSLVKKYSISFGNLEDTCEVLDFRKNLYIVLVVSVPNWMSWILITA